MTASPAQLAAVLLRFILSITLFGMVMAWAWAFMQLRDRKPLLEPSKRIDAPWTLTTVGIVVMTWLLVQIAISVIYMAASGQLTPVPPAEGKPKALGKMSSAELMAITSIANLVLLILIPIALSTATRAPLRALGLQWAGLKRNVSAGVMGFLITTPVVYFVNFTASRLWQYLGQKSLEHPVQDMIEANFGIGSAIIALISAVVLAPAAEELIFRGLIQGWLANQFRPVVISHRPSHDDLAFPQEDLILESLDSEVSFPADSEPKDSSVLVPTTTRTLAIVATSVLFGGVHIAQWPAPIAIFVLALGLGWIYDRTGSLIAPFVMHALFNGLATILLFHSMLQPKPAVDAHKPPGPAMQTHVHLPSIAAVHSRSSRP
ncbi:lysostaphin resistance A-like protein [Singulisphaera sp. PoT]|uniref:CPBP family intramembrane glutamic endopeptidase n=1 Tax=Singulisphaera sp. PoT TaxID=3411797 RepID=UPI003BF4E132